MAVHNLVFKQQVPAQGDAVWDFFSKPENLQVITPDYMRFQVLNKETVPEIYPGLIITYKVSPVLRIPMFWMTEITAVRRYRLFVDEQRRGPYRLWHHQHIFEENERGVLMTDILHYQLPLGPLGSLAHFAFVRRQLADVFRYRRQKVEEIFGAPIAP